MNGQTTNSTSALGEVLPKEGTNDYLMLSGTSEAEDTVKNKEHLESEYQSSCPANPTKEAGLTKDSPVPLLEVNGSQKARDENTQSRQTNNKSSAIYSMNYTTPGSKSETNQSLEKIDSRESSLDSNISGSDTVEKIFRKNMRLKMNLQALIDKTEDVINQMHHGIPMEIKMSRKQLQKEVRKAEYQLEREFEQNNIVILEN